MTGIPAGSVWFDVQGAQNRAHFDRGISRFTVEQLRALYELDPEMIHTVAASERLPLPGALDFLVGTGVLDVRDPRVRPRTPPLIYHVTSPMELERPLGELWPPWARHSDVQTVVTLFDLIPLVFADHYLADARVREHYTARLGLLRSADHVLAISETSAHDAEDRLGIDPERITIIDAGVSERFANVDAIDARESLRDRLPTLRDGFMLYVGGIEFRKNVERLIEAHALLPPDVRARHQLVITCRVGEEDRERLDRLGASLGLGRDDCVISGYVSDAHLAALYACCALFVFPSLYEGLGLPVLEAMTCGAPVAASGGSTTLEILGDLEATFDPYDPTSIADTLRSVIDDENVLEHLRTRSRRRAAKYTWRQVAERSVGGYIVALEQGRHKRSRVRRRLRVAWHSPWPPEQSGIAMYSRNLLAELGKHVDLDVVVSQPLRQYPEPLEPGVRLIHADDIDWTGELRGYDRHVYSMGNSRFHGAVRRALLRQPGIVLAHDVRLVGFYRWLAEQEAPEAPAAHLARLIDKQYGERIDAARFAEVPPSPADAETWGIFLTDEIQRNAERLIVHSRYAADILRIDRSPDCPTAPAIDVLPHALYTRAPRDPAGVDPATIVSFGMLSPVKGLAGLIDAFTQLAARRSDARLVLAGPAFEAELDHWRRYAEAAGVGGRVDIPGYVDRSQWEALLDSATIAVQLRAASNGEASGTVCECLSTGVPTIATTHGWFAELPDGVVEPVPRDVSTSVLAERMQSLLDNPNRRRELASAGRALARRDNFANVAARYLELLVG